MRTQARIFSRYLDAIPPGRLEWIGLRPARKQAMKIVQSVEAKVEYGLEGDRRLKGRPGSARQVSIISVEYIDVIARLLKKDNIDPALLRRNLVVSGINLSALRHQMFQIGAALFEGTALCHPCVRMEEALGKNGLAAMLGHGGICAKILEGGLIQVGDEVVYKGPAE
jgi:MOSC domain-containing protein YiiM